MKRLFYWLNKNANEIGLILGLVTTAVLLIVGWTYDAIKQQ